MNRGLWFNPQSLLPLADAGAWTRGLMLYRNQKVLSLDIEPLQNHWLLLGEVQGSLREPYEVSIEIALKPNGQLASWDSDCECPVGSQCKHGVALMLKAAYQGLQLLGDSTLHSTATSLLTPPTPEQVEVLRQAALARAQDLARLEAEAQLLRWLKELDRAGGVATDQGGNPAAHERQEHYLYLLSVVGSHGPAPELQIEAVVSYLKASGGWAKPKPIRTPPSQGQAVYDQASAVDREVLQLIRAMPHGGSYYYAYNFKPKVVPNGQVGLMALQQAASTGRLFLDEGKGTPGAAIAWGPPQPPHWEWHEVSSAHATEPGWVLRAKLANSSAKLCLNSPPLYLDAALGLCGPVQAEGIPAAQLEVLLKAPPLKPAALKKHQVDLMQRLGKLPLPPVLQALTTLRDVTPSACLQLSLTPADDTRFMGLIQAQLRFDYAGHRGWWAGQGSTVLIDSPEGRLLLQRDPEAELDAITRLYELGLMSAEKGLFGIPGDGPQQDWLHWADNDFSVLREAGFEVTLDDTLKEWITHADTLDVQLRPEGNDGDEGDEGATSPWFDLSLGMEINGQRHNILPWLPDLIAAAAASPLDPVTGLPHIPPFVYLPSPGTQGFIRLPTDTLKPWMAALLELVGDRDHDFTGDSLKLSRLDALRTGAALGEGAVWEGAQALRAMVQQLQGSTELPEVPVPTSVQASLRPYQQQGLNWLQFLRQHSLGGILADDMGLGKTLQTLVHIQIEKDAGRLTHPALIIAPVSLMGNWQRETERFCPQLRCLVLHGKERHAVADTMDQHDIVIAPYSLLQRDRERWLEAQWHLVVLDEAQNIKNASTHAAQVVGQLQTRHRLCLSGTPMENHLGEIWSLFHFLMPGFLGSQTRFKELFRTPIEKQGDPDRLAQLRARITPFMLRRTKAVVANELPPKVETVMRVELSGKQADLYETIRLGMEKTVREALNTKGLAKSQITILDALLKLRQVCCDPQLLKLDAAKKVKTSAKLEQLMEMLPEMLAEGRRILLFSQFTSMLSLIEVELKKRNLPWVKLTGQSQKRDALIEQFTSGQVPLFLISLKAGGVGLNLPQADTVIHYDPWWNPAVEAQATDRAHRIGQTQSVFVYKMVAQGTIEERILALQERKAALADSMYSGSVGRKQPLFSEGDLAELLKPLSV
ncbi:SNF2-related protein [Rhodoferax sp. UBA5149]|uniref:DEAD/DEAH box helicase n=1 Tax=Rhodoferax sp. UBA5149 TaxID=1947379 RepID=UPI0039C964CC